MTADRQHAPPASPPPGRRQIANQWASDADGCWRLELRMREAVFSGHAALKRGMSVSMPSFDRSCPAMRVEAARAPGRRWNGHGRSLRWRALTWPSFYWRIKRLHNRHRADLHARFVQKPFGVADLLGTL